jgi:hypothetical protein
MVVALLVIALAMIAGGLSAVLQGWDIVLLEHGWTLVVAGSVFTSGGAVLLGLAATVFLLGRLRRELVTIRDRWGRAEFERIAPAPIDPVAAIAAGGLAALGPVAAPAKDSDADLNSERAVGGETAGPDLQPDLPVFLSDRNHAEAPAPSVAPPPVFPPVSDERVSAEERRDHDESAGTRLKLPDNLLGLFRRKDETREPEVEAGKPADEEPREAGTDEPTDAELNAAGPEPEPSDHADEEAESEIGGYRSDDAPSHPDRVSPIVGTYTSGDNRYVMFADGSIEADTPHGIFRFGSLDELKAFIAPGGEQPTDDA